MDMDLFLLNKLQQLKAGNTGGADVASSGYLLETDTQAIQPWYSIYATNSRYGFDGAEWSSNIPTGDWSTSMQYGGRNQKDLFFGPSENVDLYSSNKYYNATVESRGSNHSSGLYSGIYECEHGINSMTHQLRYQDDWPPFGMRIVFLRNPTPNTINTTLYWQFSSRYNRAHNGASLVEYTPNQNPYTDVTSISMNTKWSYTSDTWYTDNNTSISIGGYQTRAYILCNSFHYWSSTDNGYYMYEGNNFYNIQVPLNAGLEIDLKATAAYQGLRRPDYSGGSGSGDTSDIVKFWNSIGEVYGNNEV